MPREHKYEIAPNAVAQVGNRIMREHHEDLHEAKLKVAFVFVFPDLDGNGQPKNFAIQEHGRRVYGRAVIVPLLQRLMMKVDAMVLIDASAWEKFSDRQREALLDHELHHFELKKDELEEPMTDDLGRPRLSIRPHDFEFGWFKTIAERYGIDSLEVQQAHDIKDRAGEILFDFMKPAGAA